MHGLWGRILLNCDASHSMDLGLGATAFVRGGMNGGGQMRSAGGARSIVTDRESLTTFFLSAPKIVISHNQTTIARTAGAGLDHRLP